MKLTSFEPRARLAPFVRQFSIVETSAEATRRVIPEPGIILGVRYAGSASLVDRGATTRLATSGVSGIAHVARRIRTSAGGGILLAKFHLAGAARFFADPLDELSGATLPLDQLLPPSELDRLVTRIAEASSHPLRVAILEQFLIARLRNGPPDAIVSAAARAIESSRGAIRIRALARALAISQAPLEKRFRRLVGSTPKELARLVRLRAAIAAYRTGMPLTRVAHQAGYYDQSHFIRDFRALTGEPPGRFLRSGDYC